MIKLNPKMTTLEKEFWMQSFILIRITQDKTKSLFIPISSDITALNCSVAPYSNLLVNDQWLMMMISVQNKFKICTLILMKFSMKADDLFIPGLNMYLYGLGRYDSDEIIQFYHQIIRAWGFPQDINRSGQSVYLLKTLDS